MATRLLYGTITAGRIVQAATENTLSDTGLTYNSITNTLTVDGVQWDLTPTATGAAEGLMYWNTEDGTLNLGMPGGNVNLQIGQELIMRAKNTTGAPITNGQLVYISGGTGNNAIISLAKADAEITSATTIGMATEAIADNQFGYVTLIGLVRDVNTIAYTAGTSLYLSAATAGAYTSTKPTAPNHLVTIGVVIRQHATEGVIFVRIDNGYELSELHDVYINSVADGNILQYVNANSRWENKTLASAGLVSGSGTAGRVTQWATSSTLGDSNLIGSGAGVLTLSAAGTYTLTVPATGDVALINYVNAGYLDATQFKTGGANALYVNVAQSQVFIGSGAGVIGAVNSQNVAIGGGGVLDALTSGQSNVSIGHSSMTTLTSGSGNLAIGANSLVFVKTTSSNIGIGSTSLFNCVATGNVGIGETSGGGITSGNFNTTIGYQSGYTDVPANALKSGSENTFIGVNSGPSSATQVSDSIAIGAYAKVSGSNMAVIGGTGSYAVDLGLGTTTPSARIHAVKESATTNAAVEVLRLEAKSSGTAAAGFGVKQLFQLQSSTTASQDAGYNERLWTDATHASRTALYRGTTTGNAVNIGFYGAWSHNAVSNTAITIIPNGTGDITSVGTFVFTVKDNTSATTNGGIVVLNPNGGAISLLSDGTDTLQVTCASDGSLSIARSAGSHTFSVSLWGTWQ